MRFVHVTDPHLTADDTCLYGIDPAERLRLAIADIGRECADAAFVVVTGDLVHGGARAGYERLRAILGGLGCPYHLLAGNHDDRDNMRQVFPDCGTTAEGFVQYAFDTDAGVFIALDTQTENSHEGSLCPTRLAWLEDTMNRHAGRPVYLFMHHPPFRLNGRERLRDLIAGSDTRHMFFGHLHRPLHGAWAGVPFACLRGTNHQIARDLGRTSKAPIGCLEPPGYAIVRIEDDLIVVHEQNFLDDSTWFKLRNPKARNAQNAAELAAAAWRPA
jgi:Icc protein